MVTKQKARQAYSILMKALQDKPIDKTKSPKYQLIQIDDSAHFIRGLQDIGVYLDIVK